MIRAVLFDLDGTLLDRDTSVQQFVAAQYERLAAHLSHIPTQHYISRWSELDCRGHVWKDKVYQQLAVECDIVGMNMTARFVKTPKSRFSDRGLLCGKGRDRGAPSHAAG
ncbi:MAG: hypothetical protein H0X37_25700 [Herpetosiphonaceae bacterium]|nr:hypothetical protein [Herpetosiphonaceae bacterium]